MLATSGLVSLGLAGLKPSSSGAPDDPPPPHNTPEEPGKKGGAGPAGDRAYERLRRLKADDGSTGRSDERLRDWTDRAAKFYLDAARDRYNAARRDAQGDRTERSGELARAAEPLAHVPEHLARVDGAPEPLDGPEPKAGRKGGGPSARVRKGERPDRDDDLPPPLPPCD